VATQPDFFRMGAGSFSQAGLDRWLQEGAEALRAERAQLPTTPTAFLLAPAGSTTAFVGTLAASVDAANRSFPLALFREIPSAGACEALPSLPAAHARFTQEATRLLSGGPSFDGETIAREARAVTVQPLALPEPHAWKNEPVSALEAALGASRQAVAYALRTMMGACDRTLAGAPTSANALTVDAPVTGPATIALWLEIARSRLGWRDTVPSLLWTEGPHARLLITLGPPSPLALAFLANPQHRSSRLWPLRTTVASAVDQAWATLTGLQRAAIEDSSASFGDLAAAFG
jgi:type VI secretion system protein ImpM